MRNFKRFLLVVFLLLLVAVVLIFVLENQQPLSLRFAGVMLPAFPSAVFMLLALLLGLAVGPLLVLSSKFFRRRGAKAIK